MCREAILVAALLAGTACAPALQRGPSEAADRAAGMQSVAVTPLVAKGLGIAITTDELTARLDEQDPPVRLAFVTADAKRRLLGNMIRFYVLANAAEKEGFANRRELQLALKKLMVASYYRDFFPSRGSSEMSEADARRYYDATERRRKQFEALVERLVADAHVQVDEGEVDRALAAPPTSDGRPAHDGSGAPDSDERPRLVARGAGVAITAAELKARFDELGHGARGALGTPEARRRFLGDVIRFHVLARAAAGEGFGKRPEVQFALKKLMVTSYYQERVAGRRSSEIPDAEVRKYYDEHRAELKGSFEDARSEALRGATAERRRKEFDEVVEKLVAAAHVHIDETELRRIVVTPPAAPSGDEIVIALVVPLSGVEASFGQSVLRGVHLALDEGGRRGPVPGTRVVLKVVDSRGQPDEAATALRQILLHDGPVAVIGEVASSRSIAMAPLADKYHVPVISPTATNPLLTQADGHTRPYVFRACFIDPFQGTAMARFARQRLKLKRAAILRDMANEYSLALADRFGDEFRRLGGEIVAERSYRASDQDFRSQLGGIQAERAEAIYIPGFYTDVALIGRQARELGMQQPLLGGDGWDSGKLLEQAQGALDGSFFTNHFSAEDPAAGVQAFVKRHRDAYHTTPDALSALGYDAGRVVLQAIARAREPTPLAVRDALEQGRSFKVLGGKMMLDARHDGVRSAVVFGVVRNTFSYRATVSP